MRQNYTDFKGFINKSMIWEISVGTFYQNIKPNKANFSDLAIFIWYLSGKYETHSAFKQHKGLFEKTDVPRETVLGVILASFWKD